MFGISPFLSSGPWGLWGVLQSPLVYKITFLVFPLSSSCLWGLYGGLQSLLVLVYNMTCLVFLPFFQVSVRPVWWSAAASGSGM